jgi:hypothetical protein
MLQSSMSSAPAVQAQAIARLPEHRKLALIECLQAMIEMEPVDPRDLAAFERTLTTILTPMTTEDMTAPIDR